MNRQRHFLLSVACVLVAIVAVRAQSIDDVVKGWIEKQNVPAASVAVIKDGALVKAEGYGFADVEHRVPARPDTVYKIGSVSKQFIATGIMLLVQDGKLAVGDKVSKYLQGTPATWEPITLRHLLTHTSGIVREAPGFDPYKLQPDIAVIETAYPLPLRFTPGEKYEYCNVGYFILAEIIHRVSGQPWADFLAERVFGPLGMTSTRVTTLAEIIPKRARGYAWRAGRLQNEDDWPAVRPSGAFLSTVLDLAKWEAALLGDQILKGTTKKEMWTPVTLNDGRTFPYGFGWQLDDWPPNAPAPTGEPMMRHGGSMNGFRAGYSRWPARRLTVIVLTNLSDTAYEGLTANIAIHYVRELRTAPRQPALNSR
jgi:CubicO group peptidase (beta-lactamase class C family)